MSGVARGGRTKVEGGSRRDDTSKFFDQGTNREALIPSGVRKRLRSITTFKIMKKETWKLIVQILISILTALGTTLGVTSCM